MSINIENEIKKHLFVNNINFKIYDVLESTNTFARFLAEDGEKENTVVLANRQTGGRGRKGKSFYSDSENGIYMSVLLRPDIPVSKAVSITTCAAVSVCRAIEKLFKVKTSIKWVNDIYINNKKVCGILTEASTDAKTGKPEYIILGIGVNVCAPKNDFPKELKDIAGSILNNDYEIEINKCKLIAEILNEFFSLFDSENNKIYNEYKRRMFLIGKEITVLSNECYKAKVLDINSDYSLVIENTDGQVISLNSGEISTSFERK